MKNSRMNIQKELKDIFFEFDDFCRKNNLNYFSIGGTLLGAIRHKGFIPWDDDVDVGMPREDYERFKKISNNFNDEFDVEFYEISKDFIYPYIKIYKKSTSVVEDFYIPFERGVWIDVFPIDAVSNFKVVRYLQCKIIYFLKIMIAIKCGAFSFSRFKFIKRVIVFFLFNFLKLVPKKILFKLIDFFLLIKKNGRSLYCGNLLGRWGTREMVRSYIFEKGRVAIFNNKEISVPLYSEVYLNKIYGEYMKIPKMKDREHHLVKIKNLSE